jgi:hypothetical protein
MRETKWNERLYTINISVKSGSARIGGINFRLTEEKLDEIGALL